MAQTAFMGRRPFWGWARERPEKEMTEVKIRPTNIDLSGVLSVNIFAVLGMGS